MKYNTSHFLDKLIAHEGMVLTVYQDTLGIDTIGIGRNLKDRGISKKNSITWTFRRWMLCTNTVFQKRMHVILP